MERFKGVRAHVRAASAHAEAWAGTPGMEEVALHKIRRDCEELSRQPTRSRQQHHHQRLRRQVSHPSGALDLVQARQPPHGSMEAEGLEEIGLHLMEAAMEETLEEMDLAEIHDEAEGYARRLWAYMTKNWQRSLFRRASSRRRRPERNLTNTTDARSETAPPGALTRLIISCRSAQPPAHGYNGRSSAARKRSLQK